jgi:DNA repair protein RecN (Recombination protein N)
MLQSIYIQNYALIDELNISFDAGFSIITGETGAGKSILLGALSMLVGQRADAAVLLDKSKKCSVEGVFKIADYNLQSFFETNEIDYDHNLIIRREILDNGRSRAFVNDSPVNLNILKELGDKLIDIHSQHQNSYLADSLFQLKVLDILAKNSKSLENYKDSYRKYSSIDRQLITTKEKAAKDQADIDYYRFQFNELSAAKLISGEQLVLEDELKILSHAEEIKSALTNIATLLFNENLGATNQVKEASNISNKIKNIYSKAVTLNERLNSAYIELKDIASDTENLVESIDIDPDRLNIVKSRLDMLYALCQKHRVSNSDDLIGIRDNLSERIVNIDNYEELILDLQKQLEIEKKILTGFASELTKSRLNASPLFEENIVAILRQLGMPNSAFSAKIETDTNFSPNGCDKATFLFTANKQVVLQDINKVASGGEISRVMLAIKSVIASSLAMPAVIFDEIDTGVSGDIADKMGNIMRQMSENMQVISITHLPQVASKGQNHFMVYKIDGEKSTNTKIKLLKGEERVVEIAKMLSGEQISNAAITNARVLLNN